MKFMAKSTRHGDSIYEIGSPQLTKKESGDQLYYILMALLILALGAGIVFIGGMLRFTLAVFILLIIGFNLVYWMFEETEKSEIWKREYEYDEEVNLKLRKSSDLVRRAFKGMELSQGLLEKKIRDLYLDKLKEERNLSQEEVRELLNDAEEFRKVVDDDLISDFILSKEDQHGIDEQPSSEKSKGENYEQWITYLLKRIEGWE